MAVLLVLVNIFVMVEHSKKFGSRGGSNNDIGRRRGGQNEHGHNKVSPPQKDDSNGDTVDFNSNSNSIGRNTTSHKDSDIDEKMLRILRHVGIYNSNQLTAEEISFLPSWEQVVEKFGDKGPVILGLDTCPTYRSKFPVDKRKMAVAGPFNSGTHFLYQILSNNCKSLKTKNNKNKNIRFQVPWGKHQSPNFRLVHNVEMGSSIKNDHQKDPSTGKIDHPPLPDRLLEANESVLPIVVVRDPYTWWQSMCKVRYAAHWYHVVPDHCPNFVPNHVEREWFNKNKKEIRKHYNNDVWKVDNVFNKANYTLDKDVIPLWVRYHSENREHTSLAHMWADWYNDYYQADYPRLLVRLEDLVFYPHETLKAICDCANDGPGITDTEHNPSDRDHPQNDNNIERAFEYVGDENLELSLESAIGGSGVGVDNIHGKDRTGLFGAMKKHAGRFADQHRLNGMTDSDLDFAEAVLKDSGIWKDLGYQLPRR